MFLGSSGAKAHGGWTRASPGCDCLAPSGKLRSNKHRQPRSSVDRWLQSRKRNAMIAAYIIKQYERAVVFNLGKVNDSHGDQV